MCNTSTWKPAAWFGLSGSAQATGRGVSLSAQGDSHRNIAGKRLAANPPGNGMRHPFGAVAAGLAVSPGCVYVFGDAGGDLPPAWKQVAGVAVPDPQATGRGAAR